MTTTPSPVVIVSGLRAPAALHACRALKAAGHTVVGTDAIAWPAGRFSNAVDHYYQHASPVTDPQGFERDVVMLLERHRPMAWLPTCEETFHLAHLALPALQAVLRAPSFATLLNAHRKDTFAEEALALGQGPEFTQRLESVADRDECRSQARRLVFKPVFSRFASQVLVKPTMDRLERLIPTPQAPWVAQRYLGGEEVCAYALAEQGNVLGCAMYRGKHHAGQGASVYFEPTQDSRIEAFVQRYVERHRWTGQIAFDFRRDEHGVPLAIECNPRATSGIHLWEPNAALGQALLGAQAALTPVTATPMVGLAMVAMTLPQALRQRQIRAWLRDWRRGTDVVGRPGDRAPAVLQGLSLAELGFKALKAQQGLLATSTADIEWNQHP